MREVALAVVVIAGCGGAQKQTQPGPGPGSGSGSIAERKSVKGEEDTGPVDAIAELGKEHAETSSIVPKTGSLEPGGPPIVVPDGQPATEIVVLERHGSDLRVGVLLEHVRFALWTDKQWLLGAIGKDTHVSQYAGGGEFVDLSQTFAPEVMLHAGARVRRIAHKDGWTQVRYLGAVEIDGWVSDETLADKAPPHESSGRFYSGNKTLTALPGSVIRTEMRWGTRELAVTASSYFIDEVKQVDDTWSEVEYRDGDVTVRGYLSKHEPPGRSHKPRKEENPPAPTTPNFKVASGTCLYAREGGAPVGFVVGDREVDLEAGGSPGWWTVQTDTPWGPVVFAAQGPTQQGLNACAPAGSVPASALNPPPTP